jgi:hypothetical protein
MRTRNATISDDRELYDNPNDDEIIKRSPMIHERIKSYLNKLTTILTGVFTPHPKQAKKVFLFNFCHGTIPIVVNKTAKNIKDKLQYLTTNTESHLTRMIKTPKSACAFADEDDYRTLFRGIMDLEETTDTSELFKAVVSYVKTRFSKDLMTEYQVESEAYERKICKFSELAYREVENEPGSIIINKIWIIDTGMESSGIVVMNDITFVLPYIPTEVFNQYAYPYKIGVYDRATNKITYKRGTDLMSCPYFIIYVQKLSDKGEEYGYSIAYLYDKSKPESYKIPMVYCCCAQTLYSYFKHVKYITQFDMSCETFSIDNDVLFSDIDLVVSLKQLYDQSPKRSKYGTKKRSNSIGGYAN